MICLNKVSKAYRKKKVVSDFSLIINRGEITLLCGRNGAGKTTLFHCILGLIQYEGNITIDGYDNQSIAAKRLIGFVPDEPQIFAQLSLWEHIVFNAKLYQLTDWQSRAEHLLHSYELYEHRKKYGQQCSKGMRQKLNLILGLLHRPKVLIVDEPFVGLDLAAIETTKDLFQEVKAEGGMVLIASHIVDSAKDISDRLVYIDKGQLISDLTKDQMVDITLSSLLKEMMNEVSSV